MDYFLIILGIVFILAGIAGCILPVLPGPPLVFASLLLLQFTSFRPFDTEFLLLWAGLTTLVLLADYYVPVWGTKKLGGTKYGTRGAAIGLIIGIFFFPPFGILLGPFAGAFLGEIAGGGNSSQALRSAFGSFLGFITGTLMKLGVSVVMAFFFFRNLF